MRLAKRLAHAGVASRRAAEEIVRDGRVTVAGAVVTDPAHGVTDVDAITVDGRSIIVAETHVVLVLHKPAGYVSTAKDTHGRRTVLDLVPGRTERLYPVGRLDADSTGLLLLTNDGDLAHRLTHPSFVVPKTYRVRVETNVMQHAVERLRAGVRLEDGRTAPARVTRTGARGLEITIHEGRKHQVKRMCEAVGYPVTSLHRIGFAGLTLGSLAVGQTRQLTPDEVAALGRAGRSPRR